MTSHFILAYYICKFAYYQVYFMSEKMPIELTQLKTDIKNNIIAVDFISKKTGIDQSQISRILSGKYKTKSENYNKLCKFALLNCSFTNTSLKDAINEKIQSVFNNNDPIVLNSIYRILKNLE